MSKQKIIEVLKEYVQPNRSEGFILRDATEIYEAILPYIGIPKGLTLNCVCGESMTLESALGSYRPYGIDDLTEIRCALSLPEDTPEPLVGIWDGIWRLQQRIEDLEEEVRG